jgi:hypothetical protein
MRILGFVSAVALSISMLFGATVVIPPCTPTVPVHWCPV